MSEGRVTCSSGGESDDRLHHHVHRVLLTVDSGADICPHHYFSDLLLSFLQVLFVSPTVPKTSGV